MYSAFAGIVSRIDCRRAAVRRSTVAHAHALSIPQIWKLNLLSSTEFAARPAAHLVTRGLSRLRTLRERSAGRALVERDRRRVRRFAPRTTVKLRDLARHEPLGDDPHESLGARHGHAVDRDDHVAADRRRCDALERTRSFAPPRRPAPSRRGRRPRRRRRARRARAG